jgi:hypothetical protein
MRARAWAPLKTLSLMPPIESLSAASSRAGRVGLRKLVQQLDVDGDALNEKEQLLLFGHVERHGASANPQQSR